MHGRLPAPRTSLCSLACRRVLWAKVLNVGGFDVLMTPFEPEEVLRVAFAAWSHWECDFVASTAKERLAREPEASRRLRWRGRLRRNGRYEPIVVSPRQRGLIGNSKVQSIVPGVALTGEGMAMKIAHTGMKGSKNPERRAVELDRVLRKRDGIAIEKSATKWRIQYASERDLAMRNVDRESSLENTKRLYFTTAGPILATRTERQSAFSCASLS